MEKELLINLIKREHSNGIWPVLTDSKNENIMLEDNDLEDMEVENLEVLKVNKINNKYNRNDEQLKNLPQFLKKTGKYQDLYIS